MRPVSKPQPPGIQDAGTVKPSALGDLLLNTLGQYCSLCERPLDDPILIQNKRGEKSKFRFSDWPDLLPVCVDCNFNAQQAFLDKENFKGDGQSLWPDTTTYAMTLSQRSGKTSSPFQYVLQSVNFTAIADSGERKTLQAQDQVVVKVDTTSPLKNQALNTLKLFALNTRYYNPTTNTMNILAKEPNLSDDQRMQQRTKVWNLAVNASQRLQRSVHYPTAYAMLAEQISETARAAGFWSVWMTVFWQAFGDDRLLKRLFIEPTQKENFTYYGFTANFKTSPFLLFPGTDETRVIYAS